MQGSLHCETEFCNTLCIESRHQVIDNIPAPRMARRAARPSSYIENTTQQRQASSARRKSARGHRDTSQYEREKKQELAVMDENREASLAMSKSQSGRGPLVGCKGRVWMMDTEQ